VKEDVWLRRRGLYRVIRRVLTRYLGRDDFRIVHISIQRSHLHLLVEATDERALTLGMQSFAINTARAINRESGRDGKVFPYRYHATQITTARHARHALAYVINNWRRHREDFEHGAARAAHLDPYASGLSFTGWSGQFAIPVGYQPLPVSPPATDLLLRGWQRYGPIDPWETPGPLVTGPRGRFST